MKNKIYKKSYRKKGKYVDGRDCIAIEQSGTTICKQLPKPEILFRILEILEKEYPFIILRGKKESIS